MARDIYRWEILVIISYSNFYNFYKGIYNIPLYNLNLSFPTSHSHEWVNVGFHKIYFIVCIGLFQIFIFCGTQEDMYAVFTKILCSFCGISLAYCYFISHFWYCAETEILFNLVFSTFLIPYPEALSLFVLTIHTLALMSLFIAYKSREGSGKCNYWLWNFSRAPGLMILQLLNRKTLIIYYSTVDIFDNVLLLSS